MVCYTIDMGPDKVSIQNYSIAVSYGIGLLWTRMVFGRGMVWYGMVWYSNEGVVLYSIISALHIKHVWYGVKEQ